MMRRRLLAAAALAAAYLTHPVATNAALAVLAAAGVAHLIYNARKAA
jgi:hypothetical protein